MSLYAIGDLQGCLDSTRSLLERINYNPKNDHLWFTGDLVNRGPDSLGTLRFVKELGDRAQCVLGNHDIYLLMVYCGLADKPADGSFDEILLAPDRENLIDWLRAQPLFLTLPERKLALVHAGLMPSWSIDTAKQFADEIGHELAGPHFREFLQHAYKPKHCGPFGELQNKLDARTNAVLNIMTRMRYCTRDEAVDFEYTGAPGSQPEHLLPWFKYPHKRAPGWRVIFGHWSSLGFMRSADAIGLDSGCLWGGQLTAYRLDEHAEKPFAVSCPAHRALS